MQVSPTGSNGAGFNFDKTELVTEGENFTFQIACINRTLLPCVLLAGEIEGEPGFIARVADRTNGQLQFELTSFPELGIAGPDTLRLTADGTLSVTEIYSGYVGGDFPVMDISNLWGLYPTVDAQFGVIDVIQPEMAEVTAQNGGVQLFYSFADDNFFFSRRPIRSVEISKV